MRVIIVQYSLQNQWNSYITEELQPFILDRDNTGVKLRNAFCSTYFGLVIG